MLYPLERRGLEAEGRQRNREEEEGEGGRGEVRRESYIAGSYCACAPLFIQLFNYLFALPTPTHNYIY